MMRPKTRRYIREPSFYLAARRSAAARWRRVHLGDGNNFLHTKLRAALFSVALPARFGPYLSQRDAGAHRLTYVQLDGRHPPETPASKCAIMPQWVVRTDQPFHRRFSKLIV